MSKEKKEVIPEGKSLEESKETLNMMADDKFKTEFSSLLRSRYPLFYVTTNEERRFLQFLNHYAKVEGYICRKWDCYKGLVDWPTGESVETTSGEITEPGAILEYIKQDAVNYANNPGNVTKKKEKGVRGIIYILLDYFRFMGNEDSIQPDIERRLKSIAGIDGIVTTILTGPSYCATSVLENLIPLVDFPHANRSELKQALWQVVNGVASKIEGIEKETKEKEEDLINSMSGLSILESQTACAKSLVIHKGWDISTILEEKRQIISKSGVLEYYDNTVPMEDVGGLRHLVRWIKDRKQCFSEEAVKYGLRKPKGLLTIGMPGCGKSLVCKAISNMWNMPLLRMDFGKLFRSLLGQSEARARESFKLAESIAPCILWIDEIEKGLSGVRSSGSTDGGVTSRVLSTFLTWMQEKQSPVFVVATANDHESIPPEFLRAGRFDEIFFVDLPNPLERKEIFSVLLRKRNYKAKHFNLGSLSMKSEKYSGAEIEKAIDMAMLQAFIEEKRKICSDDIEKALVSFKPLYTMREGDFDDIRSWAEGRCRKANAEEVEKEIVNVDFNKKDLDI